MGAICLHIHLEANLKIPAVEVVQDPTVGAFQDGIGNAERRKFVAGDPVVSVGSL